MRNSALILVPDGADSLLSVLIHSFRECVNERDGDTPYEFKCVIIFSYA